MRKLLFLLLALLSLAPLAAADITVFGTNEAEYVWRAPDDSLKSYFLNDLNLNLTYDKIRFGISFRAQAPEFDKYNALEELQSTDVSYEWNERFVELELNHFFARAGTFEAAFGNGLVLNAYEDTDIDNDTRLEGFYGKIFDKTYTLKALYGVLAIDSLSPQKNNTVSGLDGEYVVTDFIKVGGSAVVYRNFQARLNNQDIYSQQDVLSGRIGIDWDRIMLNAEYALSHEYERVDNEISGDAIYADMNIYLGDFSFFGAYKNYKDFNYPSFEQGGKYYAIHDLPTVNHADEPLDEYITPGTDEEGIMGELRYVTPLSMHEFVVNYSEGWDSHQKIRQSNFYGEATFNLSNSVLKLELEKLEDVNDYTDIWSDDLTPAASIDFAFWENPMHIKAEYGHEKKQHGEELDYHYLPLLQVDYSFGDYSVSLSGQHSFTTTDDLGKQNFWIGGELTAKMFEHTDLTLFAGKQKGGMVCRNGSCRMQPQFEGVRLNLITEF